MDASPFFSIGNHRLYRDGAPVSFRPSPHGGAKLKPVYLVLHYTAGLSMDGAVNWFLHPAAKASAHLVVGRDGDVMQMMPFNRVAWHAGKSSWKNLSDLNRHTIGVEMVNAGRLTRGGDGHWRSWAGERISDADIVLARHRNEAEATGWHAYTPEQVAAVAAIGLALVAAYGLAGVLGHDDVAPKRKVDPGPAFPMASLAGRILGRK